MKRKKLVDKGKYKLLVITLILVLLGLIAVADASAVQALNTFGDKYYFFKQQFTWALVGIFVMISASFVKYTFWKKISVPLFGASILLLILVLIPQIGTSSLGARRWIDLGFFSIQPSELVKLTLALYLAKLADRDKKIVSYLVPIILVLGLIMFQPDLGTGLVVAAIGASQMFAAGINLFYFILSGLVGILSVFILIITSSYRRDRLMTFIEFSRDPLGKSYHIRQILLSLGMGGLWGVGLGASKQKLLYLPESATDSIFAVLAEELGFFGSVILIALFFAFVYQALKISIKAPDNFSKVLSIGLVVWLATQIVLNLGSMVALIPITGVPLPFFSYGGSSLITVMLSVGIILNIEKYAET